MFNFLGDVLNYVINLFILLPIPMTFLYILFGIVTVHWVPKGKHYSWFVQKYWPSPSSGYHEPDSELTKEEIRKKQARYGALFLFWWANWICFITLIIWGPIYHAIRLLFGKVIFPIGGFILFLFGKIIFSPKK